MKTSFLTQKTVRLVAAAAIASTPAAVALAQSSSPGTTQTKQQAQPDQSTREFVTKAAIGDMYEMQSSRLAVEQSTVEPVKQFANRIIDDHTKSMNEMKSIVQNLQIQAPSELDEKHRQMVDALKSADAQRFNQLYRDQQQTAHREAVQLYEGYSKNGTNSQLRQFAEKTLPVLREHLQMAQSLRIEGNAQTSQRTPTSGDMSQRQAGNQPTASDNAATTSAILAAPAPTHILGSTLRGTKVYGANNEDVGEVNEVIIDRNGQVVALVVGVGGFLGLGEKDVAVPFRAFDFQDTPRTTGSTSAQNDRLDRVILRRMTKQQLEQAPSFKSDITR